VRIKAASLLGCIAKYNSLGTSANLEDLLFGEKTSRSRLVGAVCQDIHWEVRKEMCSNLIFISKNIGPEKSFKYVWPDLKELLDDEEGEVVSEAMI